MTYIFRRFDMYQHSTHNNWVPRHTESLPIPSDNYTPVRKDDTETKNSAQMFSCENVLPREKFFVILITHGRLQSPFLQPG